MIYLWSMIFSIFLVLFIFFPNETIAAFKITFNHFTENPAPIIVIVSLGIVAMFVKILKNLINPH